MSIIAALTRRWNYSVGNPGAGRLVYREGNHEYTFPIYEESGVLVLVGMPSSQRIHLFFNWYSSYRDFTVGASERILPRIMAHLRNEGQRARLFERAAAEDFQFYGELYGHRNHASELLQEAGYTWFGDFSSIEPIHEEYGLEISGIRNEHDVKTIVETLQQEFPQWHYHRMGLSDCGREPGWTVTLSMFPPQSCNSGWYDGD